MREGASRTLRIWSLMAVMSLQAQLYHRLGSAGFLFGKVIRFAFFFAFVAAVFNHTQTLAGYTLAETALFFLTFNIVDVVAQIFFRGIYGARHAVMEGDFDTYLLQPCSPLLRMAGSMVDFLDVALMVPILAMTAIVFAHIPGVGPGRALLFAALVANGLAIALALHILVAALAVRTQELENAIWIYRDLMFMGKFPVDIYAAPARWALTFVIPIAVMTSFPAQALLGRLTPAWTLYAFGLSAGLLAASLWFWRDALRRYTSVSS